MITVTAAPPFATIQDLGRTGYRDMGVPVSGIADRVAGTALNALLGNDLNAAMIEWAVAGGALRFDRAATVALGGASAMCALNDRAVAHMSPLVVSAGDELRVQRIIRGRFLLIAVRGGIDVPLVLGSRSTLVSAAIGGFDGRRLRTGDRLPIGDLTTGCVQDRAAHVQPDPGEPIHVIRGPQAAMFGDEAWSALLSGGLTVAQASDRSGVRLEGATIKHSGSASLPSEPVCVGAIQVPDGGSPIVIMHDGPTVGGYPKIAVIRSAWISQFAQRMPGDAVRFVLDR